jgi:hypothetical protein
LERVVIDGFSTAPDILEEIAPRDPRHDQAAALARTGATLDDIAAHFDCSPLLAWWLTGWLPIAVRASEKAAA